MARSSLIKIIGAFVAGLVVALASALLYVRAHEKAAPAEVVAQVEQAPAAAQPEEKATEPEPEPADTGSADTTPDTSTTEPPPVRRVKKTVVKPRPKIEPREPVQVVENTMPAPSVATPSAAPQVQQTTPMVTPEAGPTAPAPHVVELPAGMTVAIRLGEKLSTDQNYTGDAFRGTLDQQIIRNGFIIAERGSKVLGRIAEADKAGRVKGVSQLSLVLTEINTTDGQRVDVQTNTVEKQGQKSTGADTAKIAGGAALGAIIGALGGGGKGAAIGAGAGGAAGTGVVLATRGKAAVLPIESRLTFELASSVTITEKLRK